MVKVTKMILDFNARMNAFKTFGIEASDAVKQISAQEYALVVDDGNGGKRLVALRAIVKTVDEDSTPEEELNFLAEEYANAVEEKRVEAEKTAREKEEKKKRDAAEREKRKAEREAKKAKKDE